MEKQLVCSFVIRGIRLDPKLRLYNSPIKIVSETNFVDLMLGNKITFLHDIKMLKKNVCNDWVADNTVLLNLYRFVDINQNLIMDVSFTD